jgi:hypothetical protein
MTDTAKLREALAKMTPGEWTVCCRPNDWFVMAAHDGVAETFPANSHYSADAAGIVLLRNSASGLLDEVDRLRAALVEIAKGEGRFSRDRLEHASNTIWDMQQLAKAALEGR